MISIDIAVVRKSHCAHRACSLKREKKNHKINVKFHSKMRQKGNDGCDACFSPGSFVVCVGLRVIEFFLEELVLRLV